MLVDQNCPQHWNSWVDRGGFLVLSALLPTSATMSVSYSQLKALNCVQNVRLVETCLSSSCVRIIHLWILLLLVCKFPLLPVSWYLECLIKASGHLRLLLNTLIPPLLQACKAFAWSTSEGPEAKTGGWCLAALIMTSQNHSKLKILTFWQKSPVSSCSIWQKEPQGSLSGGPPAIWTTVLEQLLNGLERRWFMTKKPAKQIP